jgi:hypothetical protein
METFFGLGVFSDEKSQVSDEWRSKWLFLSKNERYRLGGSRMVLSE